MDDWIIRLVDSAGYSGVFLLMLLETIFPPVPSEVIMTVAGVSASRGHTSMAGVVASGTAGAMVGNYFWYWLAGRIGEARLRAFIDRYGRWLTLEWQEFERGKMLFEKHGGIIIMIARVLPTFRSLISVPAGLFHMPRWKFIAYSTAGTAVWSGALAGAGYVLGSQFKDVEKIIGPASTAVMAFIVIGYLWRLLRWKPAN